ncbi:COP1-interactive protein 1-like [Nicotiana sylvestris]|uniref:COP1-interactive protein 1-like n=1 Tax=Nicotiana sylvestris TaxID=4096 RepID=UPI00388C6FF7
MAAPPNFEEGQSTYRPSRFNMQYYGWWKARMHDFIMAEDSKLWDVICDGPFVLTKTVGDPAIIIPKTRKEFNDADRKAIEKNFRAKKILVCGIGLDEYNRISACQSTKEIWEALQTAHEGTTQVKQSKIDMLTTEYELFRMKDNEFIQDMHTRFNFIINELHSLGEIIIRNKLVRKILSVLPSSWESKVNAITKPKGLQKLTINELVGNLKTYEMKKKKDNERREPKREKNLVIKTDSNDLSGKDADMAYLTKRFQKMQDQYKNNIDKATKRNPVPDKRFKRKNVADNVVKQVLAAWGDSSSESKEDDDQGNISMMVVENEAAKHDSIFALMAQSDDDGDDGDDDEVNFLDVQRNLKSYSPKKLMSLANILIDSYHCLINDKDALTVELREAEQSRDDLVIVVIDLKETIESLEKEKYAFAKKITNIEHERDDLVVVVVDLKETIECVKKEKEVLIERVANFEHERYDLLVVVVDLKEIIEELKIESRPGNSQKGKKVASEAYLKLENELKLVKSSLCAEIEKNKQLQEELGRVKSDLEKSLKWTWSYDAITAMYTNNGGNRQGIRFQREKTPYNPHSKYITMLDNWLCTHCGNTVHFKETCKARFRSQQKNKIFAEKGTVKGSSQQWYMNSDCSKHTTGSTNDFLSLKALEGGSVSFGNGKKGYILDLSCLSDIDDNSKLWNRRLGHASLTLLNKLVKNDLEVITSRPLNLLHMDLCGPMRVPSRGGKRYIFVIVDDYSRFTRTLFLRTKDETFQVFMAFVKKIQVKMSLNLVCIRSGHGTEYDNANFDEFCAENGITHNFSTPRTPQQNVVVERENGTLEDMARTMLIDSGIQKGSGQKPSILHATW